MRKSQLLSQKYRWTLMAVAIASAGGLWFGERLNHGYTPNSNSAYEGPLLVIPPESLEFGDAWVQREFIWTLPVTNPTDHSIRVANIDTTCTCTSVEPRSFLVRPHETVSLRVALNLLKQAPQRGRFSRDFKTTLTAVLADDGRRIAWSLQRVTKALATADPATVFFGNRSDRGNPFGPRTVRLQFHYPVGNISVVPPTKDIDVTVAPADNGDDSIYELTVTPRLQTAGPFAFGIRVHAISQDNERLPSITIPVKGRILRDVAANPRVLSFGICAAGDPLESRIEVNSRTGDAFEIMSVEVAWKDFQAYSNKREPRVIHVSGKASGRGLQSSHITVTVRQSDGETYPISVPVRYVATQAVVDKE